MDLLPLFSFMGKITTSSIQHVPRQASNYDEVFMQQSLLFDDSLKVLVIFNCLSVCEIHCIDYSSIIQVQVLTVNCLMDLLYLSPPFITTRPLGMTMAFANYFSCSS